MPTRMPGNRASVDFATIASRKRASGARPKSGHSGDGARIGSVHSDSGGCVPDGRPFVAEFGAVDPAPWVVPGGSSSSREFFLPSLAPLAELTLVVAGRDTEFPSREWSALSNRAVEGVEIEILDETGHAAFADQPERLNAIVVAWLRRRTTTGSN